MALQTLRTALADADAGGYAVGAFNVSSIDQAIAVLDAAETERSPVIVQAIAGMSAYDDESRWWHRLRVWSPNTSMSPQCCISITDAPMTTARGPWTTASPA